MLNMFENIERDLGVVRLTVNGFVTKIIFVATFIRFYFILLTNNGIVML